MSIELLVSLITPIGTVGFGLMAAMRWIERRQKERAVEQRQHEEAIATQLRKVVEAAEKSLDVRLSKIEYQVTETNGTVKALTLQTARLEGAVFRDSALGMEKLGGIE